MTKSGVKAILVASLISMLSGCASWSVVEKSDLVSPDGSFKIEAPLGWVKGPNQNAVFLTEEGPHLQKVMMQRYDHKKAFESIKKTSSEEMMPIELADYYLASFKKERDGLEVEQLDIKPVKLSGQAAFRMLLQTTTSRGLKINTLAYGLSSKKGFYELSYSAPELHYFERDLPEFEKMVKSFEAL
ncbi:MAG: hypothetical protein ACR2PX_16455 [Endozoicomonas sp.]|uniref:hypothetical protein n=1 Tax=Endozoicomonas sp. TaxID=1892382 RepID=UPI003D9BB00D